MYGGLHRFRRRAAVKRSVVLLDARDLRRQPDELPEQRETVDAAVAAYVEWRAACTAIRSAYHAWSNSAAADARLAFLAYRASLHREEAAAKVYARLMRKVGHLVESGLDEPLQPIPGR